MDEVQRLGELLSANQRNEEHKHQQFHTDLARWESSILSLYNQIEGWMAPLKSSGRFYLNTSRIRRKARAIRTRTHRSARSA